MQDYLALLQREPDEIQHLYEDVLIHVTSFFRDAGSLRVPEDRPLPRDPEDQSGGRADSRLGGRMLDGRRGLLARHLAARGHGVGSQSHPIQIFGSDVSEKAIEKARLGVFADSAMRDMSDERRRRYFSKTDAGYRSQQERARSVRVRPARPRPRPAVFQAGPGELPQRPHLFRPAAAEENPADVSLCVEPTGLPSPRPHGEHFRVRAAVLADEQVEQDLREDGGPRARSSSPRDRRFTRPSGRIDLRASRAPATRGRPRQASRSHAGGPLFAAGRAGQRQDGDPSVPRRNRRLSSARVGRAAEQSPQDGAPRLARGRCARRSRRRRSEGRRRRPRASRSSRTGSGGPAASRSFRSPARRIDERCSS